jgi:hypothetical protein
MSSKKRKKSSSAKRSKSPSSEPETSSSEKVDSQDYFEPFSAEETSPEEAEQEAPEEEESEQETSMEAEENALEEDEAEQEAPPEAEEDALEEEPEQKTPEEESEPVAPDEEAEQEPEQDAPEEEEAERDALEEEPEPGAPEEEREGSPRDVPAMPISGKPRPVLMTESVVEPVLLDPVRTSSAILAVIGGGLCLVWVTEMLLLWFPLYLRNPAWTFGTVVQTVEILPSAGVGGALLTYGLIRHPRAPTRIVRRLSTVFAVLAGLFVVMAYAYLQSIPSAFAQAPDVSVQPLRRTVIQTVIQLVAAAATCSGAAALLWRGVMKTKRAVGP